jgi:hypothetical protein
LLGVTLLLAGAMGLASAQSGYQVTWWTAVGGGGQSSSAGGYALLGSAGQPEAGVPLSSTSYTLTGGYSGGAPAVPPADTFQVFLPLVER